ncbi:uncharacterized protein LOC126177789 [Schistocerca cancellata]|uniref:uncharacterized protein LOC126177789 n=1 Tax=Schistocerca cancellata TaxID=274614 RepID=UPI002117887C|nr:uncharacterized protein LOC126177789 [Schistocerca cancellata]
MTPTAPSPVKVPPTAIAPRASATFCHGNALTEAVFWRKLKIGKVMSIHKKGCKEDPSNYCPVAVISIFSKIFEYAMAASLKSFVRKNNIFSSAQHGFQENKTTAD